LVVEFDYRLATTFAHGAFTMSNAEFSVAPTPRSRQLEILAPDRPRPWRFDKLATIYLVLEAFSAFSISFATFLIGWSTYGAALAPPPTALPMSAFLALCILVVTVAADRVRLLPTNPSAFLWCGLDATIAAFAFLIGVLYILKLTDDYSRDVALAQFVGILVTILALRYVFASFVRAGIASGRIELCRFIVVGRYMRHEAFVNEIVRRGARPIAVFDEDQIRSATTRDLSRTILELCRKEAIDHVVIELAKDFDAPARQIVEALMEAPITIHVTPEWREEMASGRKMPGVFGLPTAIVSDHPLSDFEIGLKRCFDIAVSAVALAILAPILLAVAALIKLETPGPVVFRQTRHGYGNASIRVFKFRSMRVIEDGQAFKQAIKDDPRITRVGRFIRQTNIDELPQLLNVFRGEMSIVGPRPHPVALNESFSDKIRWFNRRHIIRPGITGWAQISGYRGETETFAKMAGRVEHDLWYVDNWSFLLDLKIVFLTIFSGRAYAGAR
jgi:Undecaprenyl-phosphate glucose phosphotransferase